MFESEAFNGIKGMFSSFSALHFSNYTSTLTPTINPFAGFCFVSTKISGWGEIRRGDKETGKLLLEQIPL